MTVTKTKNLFVYLWTCFWIFSFWELDGFRAGPYHITHDNIGKKKVARENKLYHDMQISWRKSVTPPLCSLGSWSDIQVVKGETNMTESVTDKELIPKKGGTSVVWNYFGFTLADTEQTAVICKECKKPVISKGGNTSNLFHHLKHQHPCLYQNCMKVWEESLAANITQTKERKLVSMASSRRLPAVPHIINQASAGKILPKLSQFIWQNI